MAIEAISERFTLPPPQPLPDSAQWGFASLLIGGVLLLASCVLLVFNIIFWKAGRGGIPMVFAFAAGLIGVAGVFCLGIASLVFGIWGWQEAYANRHCPALAIAGTFISLVGLAAWLIAGIDLIMILHSFS